MSLIKYLLFCLIAGLITLTVTAAAPGVSAAAGNDAATISGKGLTDIVLPNKAPTGKALPNKALADNTPIEKTLSKIRTIASPGTVALTFDDGPSPIYTAQVLAILDKYHVKATFFLLGVNAKEYPDLVKKLADDGQVIANHSQNHHMLTKLNDAKLESEIVTPQVIINEIIGKKPVCLRYPYGASNAKVQAAIRDQGIEPVSMGFNSFDYERRGVEKMTQWVLKNAYSGQVFLFHDKFEQTVEALPQIIEGIQKKGLGFSQICEN